MMHIVVTGGCGFIGGHLVEKLAMQGYQVTVVDDKRNGKFVTHQPNVDYIFEDVCNYMPPPCDAIIHLANTPRVRLSFEQPVDAILNNIGPTTHVAEWAATYNCPLYFAQSSSALYSEPHSNPYTFGKAMSEELLHFYKKHWGMRFHLLYFYNVYGPREADYGEHSTVVRAFKNQIEKGESLKVFGSGLKSRDFTHVEDVTTGIMKLLSSPKKPTQVHFGSSFPYSVLEIAEAFDHPYIYEFDKPGEAAHTVCKNPYIKRTHDVIQYIKEWKRRNHNAKSGS
jgi:UDP-glucose 4-epimerase